MDEVDVTIIGAGIIGLAIAAELSDRFDNIVILEKNTTFGQGISSRNSEVIHSGIYYPEGSLKATLCVQGARLLYKICEKYSIPHKKIGKLIVACDQAETDTLQELLQKGQKNNVENLSLFDRKEINHVSPNINAIAAIYSPNTGIVDVHLLMKHFLDVAESRGVLVAYNSEVVSLAKNSDMFLITLKQEEYRFKSRIVINSAGLSSDLIAELAGIDIHKCGYKIKYCKGSYFAYSKPSPVNKLIYPVPQKNLAGLGVHATLDLGHRLRFGPDVEYTDFIEYTVDEKKKNSFYESARKIIHGLDPDAFSPDMAGIRPKLHDAGEKTRDFIIKEESDRGLEGLINLIGIESPGLTATPAIAAVVKDIVSKRLN